MIARTGSKPLIGLPWFRKEDFASLRDVFSDRENVHDTWEEWLQSALKMEAAIKAQGGRAERVDIEPKAFADWCKRNGLKTDGRGRQAFAAAAIASRMTPRH